MAEEVAVELTGRDPCIFSIRKVKSTIPYVSYVVSLDFVIDSI
jgi:hypothetical protein